MALGPREAGTGAGLPTPTPGSTIQNTVLLLSAMVGVVPPSQAICKLSYGESQTPPLFSTTVGSAESSVQESSQGTALSQQGLALIF